MPGLSRRVKAAIGLVVVGVLVAIAATLLPWLEDHATPKSFSGWDLVSYGVWHPGATIDTGPHWVFRSSWCEYPTSTVVTALPFVAVSAMIAAVLCLVTVALWRGWRRIAIWSAAVTVLGGVSLVLLWLRNFASFVHNCLGLGLGTWFELGAGLLVVKAVRLSSSMPGSSSDATAADSPRPMSAERAHRTLAKLRPRPIVICHAGTMRTRSLRALAPLILALVCTVGIAGTADAATSTPSKKDIAAATAVVLKAAKLQYSGRYGPAYDLLVPSQQDLMSRDDFVANCTVEYTTPITIKKFEPKQARYKTVTVPGTSSEQRALALTISVTATNGKRTVTQPVDVLAFPTSSGWTWAMTQAQLDGCGGTAPVG